MRFFWLLLVFVGFTAGQSHRDKEAALGKTLADEFRRRTPPVNDGALLAYLTKLAARLNEFAQSPFRLTIEIAGDSNREAVGFPGGYLFVPLRLLANAESESAVAAPVAHALAHAISPLATRQLGQAQIGDLATIPVIFMGGWSHAADGTLIPLAFRKVRDEQEAEAARLAAEWTAQAGMADPALDTEEFAAVRERVRALLALTRKPPSLRKAQ